MKRPSQAGFTLIEMMVGMAIAALLAIGVTKLFALTERSNVYAHARTDADATADNLVKLLRSHFMGRDFQSVPSHQVAHCQLGSPSRECSELTIKQRLITGGAESIVDVKFETLCVHSALKGHYSYDSMRLSCLQNCNGNRRPIVRYTAPDGTTFDYPRDVAGLDKAIGATVCVGFNRLVDGSSSSIQFDIEVAYPSLSASARDAGTPDIRIVKRNLSLPLFTAIGTNITILPDN